MKCFLMSLLHVQRRCGGVYQGTQYGSILSQWWGTSGRALIPCCWGAVAGASSLFWWACCECFGRRICALGRFDSILAPRGWHYSPRYRRQVIISYLCWRAQWIAPYGPCALGLWWGCSLRICFGFVGWEEWGRFLSETLEAMLTDGLIGCLGIAGQGVLLMLKWTWAGALSLLQM